ncbi:MAG TPA: MucB/RseB C-terminal domain-containing protein [Xanthomonadaceae bacterium]|nr:MucB/RseB C-terminal domain-containing protein [Xanthomonadaceae bacterium]
MNLDRMRCGGGRALLLLAASLVAAPVLAQDAEQWLQRMQQALRERDYVGTFVYGDGTRLETMRVFHRVDGDGEHERLVALSGEPAEIVRSGSRVTCVGNHPVARSYPGAGGQPVLPGVPDLQPGALAHYRLELGAESRIANRPARQIEVRAGDAFRYGYRLWLDTETALLLKSVRMGPDGVVVEQLMFTELEPGRTPTDAELDLDPATRATATTVTVPSTPESGPDATPRWRVLDPPPGFRLSQVRRSLREGSAEHQLFSDGIAHVSVYVEPAGGAAEPSFSASEGAMSVYARRLDGHRVHVVGDVPLLTVQRFAQGLQLDGG